jgi:hypothetical protein
MHSRPTAAELIEAVREHIEREILPTLSDPRLRFQTLVAAHALSIVERELNRGEEPSRQFLGRLQSMGLTALAEEERPGSWREAEESLCQRIRRGDADQGAFREEALAHIRATLLERLRVASPDFLPS